MAMSGMDWMIDSILKAAGFDPVEAKAMIAGFADKFAEQDKRLQTCERVTLENNRLLAEIHSAVIAKGNGHGENSSEHGQHEQPRIVVNR